MPSEPIPVACTLTEVAAADQLLEWADLQTRASHVEALPAGARMRFPADLEPLIADLTRREAACCAFLEISTNVTGDEIVLDVTSSNPDALPVISQLAGLPQS